MNNETPDPTFRPCPFCNGTPRYLPHKAGFYTERVICDPCGFYLSPEKWEACVFPPPVPGSNRIRHVKSGGLYEVIAYGKLEVDGSQMTIYRSVETGQIWVRPTSEFKDGRFVPHVEDPST